MEAEKMKIGNRLVGKGEPCFIVAEISCNHHQKKEHALKLIEEAKNAGADGVKFQTYTPDTITLDADTEYFKISGTLWEGKTLYELYSEAYTPWEWFRDLKEKAEGLGLAFFSSPFDETAADFLEGLGVPAYKVASFEINHIPLLKHIAEKKKPIILSTGVSTLEDIELAVKTIREAGNQEIAILKCTSSYPALYNEMNLSTIADIRDRFGVVSGLSDHSMSISVPVAAAAVGASIIEKHFTLSREAGGPDAKFSLEPKEFREMVKLVREAEEALGNVDYEPTEKAKEHRFLMRSIFASDDIKKGGELTKENIRVVRPGNGMHPKHYPEVLGKRAKLDIKKGTPLSREMVE